MGTLASNPKIDSVMEGWVKPEVESDLRAVSIEWQTLQACSPGPVRNCAYRCTLWNNAVGCRLGCVGDHAMMLGTAQVSTSGLRGARIWPGGSRLQLCVHFQLPRAVKSS